MIIIKDMIENGTKFPLAKLLMTVIEESGGSLDGRYRIVRIGGNGEAIWALESKLNFGEGLTMSLRDLLDLEGQQGSEIDTLRCISETITLGISDASFMFVQAADKAVESRISSQFDTVEELPDRRLE